MNARIRIVPAVVLFALALVIACAPRVDPVDAVAERYVKLVIQLGAHDVDEVDSYYGPPAWRIVTKLASR